MIISLLSQGQSGRQQLQMVEPIMAMLEQKEAQAKAEEDNKRAQKNARNQAFAAQGGQLAGTLGGMYLMGKMAGMGAGAATGAGAAAGAGAGAGASGALATPTLLSVGAPTTSAGAGAGASTLGSVGSVALPVAAAAAALSETWEGGAKDILRGRGNRQDWTNMGVNAVTGVVPNMLLRWAGKPSIGRMMTSGKSDDQLIRDDFRGSLKTQGIADEDYNVTLADGTKFDIGKDGKATLLNTDGKTERRYWNVDMENPLAKYAVTVLDPRVRELYGNAQNPEQYTAMLVNAVTSNAKSEDDVRRNINAVLGNSELAKGLNLPVAQSQTSAPTTQPQQSAPQTNSNFMAIPNSNPMPRPSSAATAPADISSQLANATAQKAGDAQLNQQMGNVFGALGASGGDALQSTQLTASPWSSMSQEQRDKVMQQLTGLKGLFAVSNQQR
jgi:hypothetical protein